MAYQYSTEEVQLLPKNAVEIDSRLIHPGIVDRAVQAKCQTQVMYYHDDAFYAWHTEHREYIKIKLKFW